MKNALAIARKELNIYFATPIAYVMLTVFVTFGSYFFLRLLGGYQQVSLQYMRLNAPEMMNRLNFQDAIFRNLFFNLAFILMLMVPFLSMRLIAEERSSRTIELLNTTPVTPTAIVLGKYAAGLFMVVSALALTATYPITLQLFAGESGLDWKSIATCYLGLVCAGAAFMAVGLFVSSLTDSQIVAALLGLLVMLLLWVVGWAASDLEGVAHDFVAYLAIPSHLESFMKGTLELKDIAYFLSIILLGLFATHRAVEAHRWS